MLSTRDVRQKIRTIRNIQQICRAMKTVASIRLRKAEQRVAAARPYREQIAVLAGRVAAVTREHPFLQARPVSTVGMVVVTSDRGLAGGYNANALRKALSVARPDTAVAVSVGRRGHGQLANRGYRVVEGVVPLGGEPDTAAIWRLADRLGQWYANGTFDRIVIVYTRFLGGTRTEVASEVLLPIRAAGEVEGDTLFEPAPAALLGGILDRYLRSQVLGAVLEASASEHAARVAAMSNASDNAEEMIATLTLTYNKARQAGITRELSEIVSTSEATG